MLLRGASADALAALSGELESTLSGGADAERVGDDLFAVALVVRSDGSLRRVFTDTTVPPEAKAGLVEDLFGGKADGGTLQLVKSAVGRRWTVGRNLADALERLSEIATVKSSGDQAGRLADELFVVGQLVKANPQLRDALSDPARTSDDKVALVGDLLDGKALPATVTLTKQALAGTYRTVSAALAEYQQVAAAVHSESVAEVRVARPLTDADRQRLTDALARQYGRAVHLNEVIDPDVIGGLRVEIGDDVIDGTVASRLSDAGRKLAG
ncbi:MULTISPECIES: F0F1 ATP synthase subunit delta [unclassified Nocardioides]|uniref:F0F1 ATP synthase subunit delta n=1 Tax=unclassified Nocardioides TaxID=2615069 RepID=UPI0006F55BD0|nr:MULTISPECIES: F0F1 ATP synthase subunit delta [unclassified Nocardioides]KQY54509.1 ATP synthase subunit delta [Nocardioides sp. Root140]KQZ66384.1 ATP synthase subunit delta [Nocardioides sp. Root151]KRF19584.1 ATP synthase subunit delta [Nocardioides sp. Soil796]